MDLQERLTEFIKEHFVALLIGGVGLTFLVYGFVSFYYVSVPKEEVQFNASAKPSTTLKQKNTKEKKITVDVSGAVNKPGVYMLSPESRVQDAIVEAGGLAGTVDQQKVSQSLNLAAPLTDGAKLYIPVLGDQTVTSQATSGKSSGTVQSATSSIININSATEDELDALPGVGEVTASKIIENRPYTALEELVEKKAVGQATFEKIKDQISVY